MCHKNVFGTANVMVECLNFSARMTLSLQVQDDMLFCLPLCAPGMFLKSDSTWLSKNHCFDPSRSVSSQNRCALLNYVAHCSAYSDNKATSLSTMFLQESFSMALV